MSTLNCQFSVANWQEQPSQEWPTGEKMARAQVAYSYEGDIKGTSQAEFQLHYFADGSAVFTALERIEGTIQGQESVMVLRHWGVHKNNRAEGHCEVVSATGHWQDLTLKGQYIADSQQVSLTLIPE